MNGLLFLQQFNLCQDLMLGFVGHCYDYSLALILNFL